MYKDRSRVRDKGVRIYFNDHEAAEVESAAAEAGRERASFVRDAALVVARFIRSRRTNNHGDLMQQVTARLGPQAANDDCMLSIAS